MNRLFCNTASYSRHCKVLLLLVFVFFLFLFFSFLFLRLLYRVQRVKWQTEKCLWMLTVLPGLSDPQYDVSQWYHVRLRLLSCLLSGFELNFVSSFLVFCSFFEWHDSRLSFCCFVVLHPAVILAVQELSSPHPLSERRWLTATSSKCDDCTFPAWWKPDRDYFN